MKEIKILVLQTFVLINIINSLKVHCIDLDLSDQFFNFSNNNNTTSQNALMQSHSISV
jgi:hypothetical protein